MNAVKVDSARRIRLTVLTPGDYYEPEVRGGDAEKSPCAGCRHRAAVSPGWRRFGRLKKARCGSPIAGTRSKRRPAGDSEPDEYSSSVKRVLKTVDWNSSWAQGSRALAVLRWSWL